LKENYKLSLQNCTDINDDLSNKNAEINYIKVKNDKQIEQNNILSNRIIELQNKLNESNDNIKILTKDKN